MLSLLVLSLAIIQTVYSQETFNCPHDNGFYPHATSCDLYWQCADGESELKVCGNGLGFADTDPDYLTENCDYLDNVDCGDRLEIEPPIEAPNCPRLYGVFADDTDCTTFWNCWNGEAKSYQCAPGLAYDRESKVCMWADQVPECTIEEVANGFECPDPAEAPAGSFTRHAHPEDCRKYYVCLQGIPREYGCPIGTVYDIGEDDFSGNCADPEFVEGCEDYYGDLDVKSLSKLGLK